MSNPTESPLSAAAADALSGTADAHTGAIYNTIGAGTYYTAAYQKEAIWNRAMALSNALRVVKDGTLTFGVMAGYYDAGFGAAHYAGSSANALSDNAVNSIYIDASGNLQVTTGSAPSHDRRVPLATVTVTGGTYSTSDISDSRSACVFRSYFLGDNIEASTAGSGIPNTLVLGENGKVLTNEGATARAYNALPAAVAGLDFRFVVQDSDGMRITAAAGDTIRIAGSVSAAAGYIQNATIGSAIHLIAINATEWIAVSYVGTWTVDS